MSAQDIQITIMAFLFGVLLAGIVSLLFMPSDLPHESDIQAMADEHQKQVRAEQINNIMRSHAG